MKALDPSKKDMLKDDQSSPPIHTQTHTLSLLDTPEVAFSPHSDSIANNSNAQGKKCRQNITEIMHIQASKKQVWCGNSLDLLLCMSM